VGQSSSASASARTHLRSRRLWLAAGAAVLALAQWTRWMPLGESVASASVAQPENAEGGSQTQGQWGLDDAVASVGVKLEVCSQLVGSETGGPVPTGYTGSAHGSCGTWQKPSDPRCPGSLPATGPLFHR
jgi:hypothetical protein